MPDVQPSAFLAVGDPFLTDQFFQQTASSFSKSSQTEIRSFYISETSLDTLLGQARSLPFLSEAQVFRIRDFEKLKNADSLARYFENPFTPTLLFFESPAVSKEHPVYQLMIKYGQIKVLSAENQPQNESGGSSFIKQKLKRAGKTASPQVLARLEGIAGASPSFLDSILEKMILYAGDKAEITEDILEMFQENLEETDAFQFTNALLAGKTGEALMALKKLLQADEKELIPFLGLLHWQVRRLWAARVMFEEGVSEQELLKRSKVYSKQAPFFMRQVRMLDRARLERAVEGLYDIDRKVKTGQAEGLLELELWTERFTRKPAPSMVR